MVNKTTQKKCYDRNVSGYSILPANHDHNCELWENDHQDNSHISNVMMRKMFNIASTALTTVITYKYLQSDVFGGHNKDLLLYFSLISIPVVMAQSNIAIKAVDSIYCTSGNDIVASFTKDVNSAIDMVTSLPKNIYGLFFSSIKKDESSVEEKNEMPAIISQSRKIEINMSSDSAYKASNDNVIGKIEQDNENVA